VDRKMLRSLSVCVFTATLTHENRIAR